MGRRRIDITGHRFNMLVAIEYDTSAKKWVCRCDCGTTTLLTSSSLRRGGTVSCGCYRRNRKPWNKTHGERGTPENNSWRAMRQRCLNPNAIQYKYYGGRGITICKRWDNFASFLEDMGRKPTPRHSLDRIDNDGPYSPDNCQWSTHSEQVGNRRTLTTYKKSCVVCGKAFTAKSHKARYCSTAHSSRYHRELRMKRQAELNS